MDLAKKVCRFKLAFISDEFTPKLSEITSTSPANSNNPSDSFNRALEEEKESRFVLMITFPSKIKFPFLSLEIVSASIVLILISSLSEPLMVSIEINKTTKLRGINKNFLRKTIDVVRL